MVAGHTSRTAGVTAMLSRAVDAPVLIPVAKPDLGDEELEAVRRPLSAGWLTQGPEVEAFEREFAAFVGAPHACAVSNCTTALHLALKAAGVGSDDEVITVSHSFIATANAVRYCRAVPLFVDVRPDTYNIDPGCIESAVTPRTKAVLVVHQLGMPCELPAILAIARRHGLAVIEDAACAAGSELQSAEGWERIGRPHGDIACFSFHPRKVMTTGDGGMLTTRNPEWDAQFRRWRQHSMTVPAAARHVARDVVFEEYADLGFNYRLTDLQAAIGREQLRRLPEMVQRRRVLAEGYRDLLSHVTGVTLPVEPLWARSNWQSYCVGLPAHSDQRRIMQSMLDDGVSTRRAVMCAHREPAYRQEPWSCGRRSLGCNCAPGSCEALRTSEWITAHGLILPLYGQMTGRDQLRVVDALARALDRESGR